MAHTHFSPPQSGAISDSEAGSQGAVTGLLGLPGTLSISSLIPSCRGRSETTVWVCTLTVRKSREAAKIRAQDEHNEKGHLQSLNPPFPLSGLFFQDKLLTELVFPTSTHAWIFDVPVLSVAASPEMTPRLQYKDVISELRRFITCDKMRGKLGHN